MLQVEIIVKGWIDEEWRDWLGGLAIRHSEPGRTIISGVLPDQAAAYGVIARMRDLGFQLSSVKIEGTEKDNT